MQDPSTKQTEREAYSEFVAALDTARSEYMDALKELDAYYADNIRSTEPNTQARVHVLSSAPAGRPREQASNAYRAARAEAVRRYDKARA